MIITNTAIQDVVAAIISKNPHMDGIITENNIRLLEAVQHPTLGADFLKVTASLNPDSGYKGIFAIDLPVIAANALFNGTGATSTIRPVIKVRADYSNNYLSDHIEKIRALIGCNISISDSTGTFDDFKDTSFNPTLIDSYTTVNMAPMAAATGKPGRSLRFKYNQSLALSVYNDGADFTGVTSVREIYGPMDDAGQVISTAGDDDSKNMTYGYYDYTVDSGLGLDTAKMWAVDCSDIIGLVTGSDLIETWSENDGSGNQYYYKIIDSIYDGLVARFAQYNITMPENKWPHQGYGPSSIASWVFFNNGSSYPVSSDFNKVMRIGYGYYSGTGYPANNEMLYIAYDPK